MTDWLSDWLIGWLTNYLTDWLTIWLTDWLTDWLTIWLTDWLTIWLTNWLTDWSCSARLPSKMKLWSSKTKLLCETSFKNEALKIENVAFLRGFLQNWTFEVQKRRFSARLASKMKLWSSKTKLFCETSFKIEALKLKNEAFARDFLQKWSFEHQKRNISARLPSKMTCWPHAWLQNYNTF